MTLREAKELLEKNGYRVVSLSGGSAWGVYWWLMGERKHIICPRSSDLINFAKGVDAA